MILLIILQLLVAPMQEYPQIQSDGTITEVTDKIPATAYEKWVWCNICHQHLPEVNGILYDYISDQGIGQRHAHQNGWAEEQPLDSHNTGIYFLLVLAAIYCFYLMVKPEKE